MREFTHIAIYSTVDTLAYLLVFHSVAVKKDIHICSHSIDNMFMDVDVDIIAVSLLLSFDNKYSTYK